MSAQAEELKRLASRVPDLTSGKVAAEAKASSSSLVDVSQNEQLLDALQLPKELEGKNGKRLPSEQWICIGRTTTEEPVRFRLDFISFEVRQLEGKDNLPDRVLINGLSLLMGENQGLVWDLSALGEEGILIGRQTSKSRPVDISIENKCISQEHASLRIDETGRVWLFDHSSRNGTFAERIIEVDSEEETMPPKTEKDLSSNEAGPLEDMDGEKGIRAEPETPEAAEPESTTLPPTLLPSDSEEELPGLPPAPEPAPRKSDKRERSKPDEGLEVARKFLTERIALPYDKAEPREIREMVQKTLRLGRQKGKLSAEDRDLIEQVFSKKGQRAKRRELLLTEFYSQARDQLASLSEKPDLSFREYFRLTGGLRKVWEIIDKENEAFQELAGIKLLGRKWEDPLPEEERSRIDSAQGILTTPLGEEKIKVPEELAPEPEGKREPKKEKHPLKELTIKELCGKMLGLIREARQEEGVERERGERLAEEVWDLWKEADSRPDKATVLDDEIEVGLESLIMALGEMSLKIRVKNRER